MVVWLSTLGRYIRRVWDIGGVNSNHGACGRHADGIDYNDVFACLGVDDDDAYDDRNYVLDCHCGPGSYDWRGGHDSPHGFYVRVKVLPYQCWLLSVKVSTPESTR